MEKKFGDAEKKTDLRFHLRCFAVYDSGNAGGLHRNLFSVSYSQACHRIVATIKDRAHHLNIQRHFMLPAK